MRREVFDTRGHDDRPLRTPPRMSAHAAPIRPHTVLIASVATAALAGLLFGFDTAVIAGVTGALKARFALGDAWLGFTVSSAL